MQEVLHVLCSMHIPSTFSANYWQQSIHNTNKIDERKYQPLNLMKYFHWFHHSVYVMCWYGILQLSTIFCNYRCSYECANKATISNLWILNVLLCILERVCMYVCMYVCIYVCMYVCIYVCMYICMYVYMYVYMYVCMYVCMYICMCICMYVCIYVCMYVCMYVCRVKLYSI